MSFHNGGIRYLLEFKENLRILKLKQVLPIPSTHITWVKLKANQQHQQEWNMLKEEEESMRKPSMTRAKLEQMMKKLSNLERAH
jgi:2-keto-3-deoxy-galactonokinase